MTRQNHRAGALAALLVLTLAPVATLAQLPSARLNGVFPPGGKIGATVEVTAQGADLDAAELRFSHDGITAKPASAKGDSATERKFTVTIGKDVPPGLYEARAAGRFGVSNPRAFAVGTADEVTRAEPPKPDSKDAAVTIGTVVNARATAGAMDPFTFEAKQGKRLLITVAAREVDSKLMPVMALVDDSGRELARSRRGELIDFTPLQDGTYTLRVHDLLFRGGPEYAYRVSIGTGPYVDFVLPPAAEPGKRQKFTLYGRNLPGGTAAGDAIRGADRKPLEKLEVEIDVPAVGGDKKDAAREVGLPLPPSAAGIEGFSYRLCAGDAVSNPVLISYAPRAVTAEQPANESADAAQAITVPAEIAGQFYPRGDRDWYSFDAKKGDVYWIEATCERLGTAAAPFVLVQRLAKKDGAEQFTDVMESPEIEAAGSSAATGGLRIASRDPAMKLEAKEDGSYRVMVRDLFGASRDDPSIVYRLSVRKAEPDFRVAIAPIGFDRQNREEASTGAPLLRRGGAAALKVLVFRRDGFDGEVRVEAEGLPKGVTCEPATIPGKETVGGLVLSASDNAEVWAGPVRFVARAKVGDREVAKDARGATMVWAVAANDDKSMGAASVARLTGDVAFAVSAEPEPLTLVAGEGKPIEAPADGKVKVTLKVTRRAEVKAALKVKAAGPDAIAKLKEITIEPKADSGSFEMDLKQMKLAPGTYTFYFQTSAAVKYARPVAEPAKGDEKKDGEKKDEKKDPAKEAKEVTAPFFSNAVTLRVLAPGEKVTARAE